MKILDELIKDASLSIPKLSKKINVNSSVVYSRIKRLIKRKIIESFTISINDSLLGFNVSALVGLNIDSKIRDGVINELLKLDEVKEMSEITGRFDLIILVKSKSLEELHRLLSVKIGRINGVSHSETFIEMKRHNIEGKYYLMD